MDADRFWSLMEGAENPEALHDALERLDQDELAAFEEEWESRFWKAYRWDLWGAMYVIGGGCGDDAFDYARAWLLSRGRQVFTVAMTDPDRLIEVEPAVEEAQAEGEEWVSPTTHVVKARTGEFAWLGDPFASYHPGEPTGEPWDEDDLAEMFPRLAASSVNWE